MFRRIFDRMSAMTELAWTILHGSLMISCAMLACAVFLLAAAFPISPDTYRIYQYARELYTMPTSILLIGVLGSVIAEDIIIQKGR